jgi:UDP-GlcNAc:undecaprenyl-phosphate/decaprenyl-phosphate GlcNAc-1-phosphate transferase
MRSALIVFASSCALSLLLTPIVRKVACFFDCVDSPTNRKVHTQPVPRLGGIALYLAFYLPFLGSYLYLPSMWGEIATHCSAWWILAGSTLVFGMGVFDDIFRLKPGVKLCVQLVAAYSAYMGGLGICRLELPWHSVLTLGGFAMPVTMLWFVLVINGINLIDGLDGLAAGVTLFASLVLLAVSLMSGKYLVAAGLAALAGANLGFLRYNFNPACIFMGDSGSYFLGYMLAALSILGSMKSEATVAILIPIIALGVPLLDTVMAPIRRIILGKKPFHPDKSHIHHKLLKLGLTHRNAVLLMYGATILLGVFTLLIVRIEDRRSALLLLLLVPIMFVGLRRLGYLNYLGHERILGYMRDVADETGLKKHRRAFLDKQIAIDESQSADEMWSKVGDALQILKVDVAEIQFDGVRFEVPEDRRYEWRKADDVEETMINDPNVSQDPEELEHRTFYLELPLTDSRKRYGTLHLKKDIVSDPLSYYTLRRIEHLRRSIVRKMRSFEETEEELRSPKKGG